MKETQNEFFDKIEDFIDKKGESKFLNDLEKNQGLKDELKFRLNIQENWNKASKLEEIKNQTKKISMKKNQSNQFVRYASYAAAACLLFFVSVPMYKFLTSKENNKLEINQADVKSALTFYDARYRQISPINGQWLGEKTIIFEWETSLEVKTSLVITNMESGEIVVSRSINSEVKNYKLSEKLEKGKYSWKIDGFKGENIFYIK